MSNMVRKQIYIEKRQQALLKHQARARGLSEAELVRQAIDSELLGSQRTTLIETDAWEQARQFILFLREQGPIPSKPRAWKREDLYDERLDRYGRHSD